MYLFYVKQQQVCKAIHIYKNQNSSSNKKQSLKIKTSFYLILTKIDLFKEIKF